MEKTTTSTEFAIDTFLEEAKTNKRFQCLDFAVAKHEDQSCLKVSLASTATHVELCNDMEMISSIAKNNKDMIGIQNVKVECSGKHNYSTDILVRLLSVIGKIPHLHLLHVTSKESPFPVEALSSCFWNTHELVEFEMRGEVEGTNSAFHELAKALKACHNLAHFWIEETDAIISGEKQNQSIKLSKWDPVITVIGANHCCQDRMSLCIRPIQGKATALSEEASHWIAELIREEHYPCLTGFRPCFSQVDDLMVYCEDLFSFGSYRVNFYVNFFGETPNCSFLHQFKDRARIAVVKFSVLMGNDLEEYEDGDVEDIDIELSNELAISATHILDHFQKAFPDNELKLVEHDMSKQYLYQTFQQQNLLKFDPNESTAGQWLQLMSVLGGLCQDEQLEGQEYDLSSLFLLISEYRDDLPSPNTETD